MHLFGVLTLIAVAGAGTQLFGHEGHSPPPESVPSAEPSTRVLDLDALFDLADLVDKLADYDVVYVGESHDRYEHHLNQLKIIQGLHKHHPDLVIGMEFFQQPFQAYLDQYVSGEISEREFVKKTEYFERWRFDYRLYRPILRFAREAGIPVLALNLPRELTQKVGRQGIDGLDPEEREQIPDEIDRGDEAYRERVRKVFERHPHAGEREFEHFLEVQLLWDEGMAERAASYLKQYPQRHMVILAGSGHIIHGQGIPQRLERRVAVTSAIVLNGDRLQIDPSVADYLLFPQPAELPAAGLLGVFLDLDGEGISVQGFADDSGAKAAGMKKGDQITQVGDVPVESYSDIRLALMDQLPGEKVEVKVLRKRVFLDDENHSFQVELH